ncbi:hypothetical protein [Altericista sp. CCNU0014]|uniref:hypothetical protein n=1 Tax=Altericista sp. CCNU0014 TaxID=3082949 RepID=UPI00384DBCBB
MMNPGSYEFKKLFCRSFTDSHAPYSADSLVWPILDDAFVGRLQSIPFWGEVLLTQHNAARVTRAFAQTLKDPMVKETVTLLEEEQQRLVAIVRAFLMAYGIPSPVLPTVTVSKNPEAAFIRAGYRKCLDLFVADGLRVAAAQVNFIPDEINQRFASLLTEHNRHSIFLVNWMAYQKVKLNRRWNQSSAVPALWNRSAALVKLMSAFRAKDEDERPPAERWMAQFSAESFLTFCLSEHQKQMQAFDPELLRPQLAANLATVAREAFKVWPQRRVGPPVNVPKPP